MTIQVKSGNTEWSNFEKNAWSKADIEHYGKPLDWEKNHFIISAENKTGKQIGALRMNIEVGVSFIEALIVDESVRGSGLGRQLVIKAEETAKKNNSHKIYLVTGKDWDAVSFYKKLGYKITAELPDHYFHTDFVEMTKFLEK